MERRLSVFLETFYKGTCSRNDILVPWRSFASKETSRVSVEKSLRFRETCHKVLISLRLIAALEA